MALTYVARPFPSANLQPYYFKVRFNGRTSIDLIERDLEKRTSLILERNLTSSAGLTLPEISAKAVRQLNDEFWGMYYFNGSVLLVQKTDGSIVSPQNQSSYVASPGDKVQIIYNSAATAFNKYKSVTRFTLV